MGTDINIYFETYNETTKQWASADTWIEEYGELDTQWDQQVYSSRCYELFAMLANVRNSDDIIPFSEPRGIPKGTDKRIAAIVEDEWGTSHFTLQELLSFNWGRVATINRLVPLQSWAAWQDALKHDWRRLPNSWCSWASGRNVTEDKARELLKGKRSPDEFIHVESQWQRPYWFIASGFWSSVIPHMLTLGKPENVRMVFCFG